jgi:hypothetical protein
MWSLVSTSSVASGLHVQPSWRAKQSGLGALATLDCSVASLFA